MLSKLKTSGHFSAIIYYLERCVLNIFKKFLSYYKPYKAVLFLDLLFAGCMSAIDIAYPQFLRQLTNTLFSSDKDTILFWLPTIGAILIGAYIFQSFCSRYVAAQDI